MRRTAPCLRRLLGVLVLAAGLATTIGIGIATAGTGIATAGTGEVKASLGPGSGITVGIVQEPHPTNPCPGSAHYQNHDSSFEDGYCWQYEGCTTPFYGAFAEGYDAWGSLCGIRLMLSALPGHQSGQTLDLYAWDNADENPGAVVGMVVGVDPGPVAIWPTISAHDLPLPGTEVQPVWVGYWGDWPGQVAGWYLGADQDGLGGFPRTHVAPGIGYPTGWQDPSDIWAPTMSLGISAYFAEPPPPRVACCFPDGSCARYDALDCMEQGGTPDFWHGDCDPNPCPQPTGACCLEDGSCVQTDEASCGGVWLGADTACVPNPCGATSVRSGSWGSIKSTYR